MSQPEPPFSDPTPTELEMILDATNISVKGRPLARIPEQGIKDMQARIELLTRQIQQVKERLQNKPLEFQASAQSVLADLNRNLGEAQDRLREYQIQLQGLN